MMYCTRTLTIVLRQISTSTRHLPSDGVLGPRRLHHNGCRHWRSATGLPLTAMDLPSGVRARKVGSPAEKPYLQSNKAIKVVSRKQSSSSQVRVDTTIAADERDDTQRARFSDVRPRQTMVAGATRPSLNDGTRREDGTQHARIIDPPRQRMQFRKTISAHPNAFAHHQDNRARTKGTSYFPSSSRQSAWSDGPSYSVA